MEKIITAELSFISIESASYLDDINKVLEMIKACDVEYEIGMISTSIKGKSTIILDLISKIVQDMDPICGFRFDIKISNICGCKY